MSKLTNTNHLILIQAAKKLAIKTDILSSDPPKILFTKNGKSHLIAEKSFGLNSTKSINLSHNKSTTIKKLKQAHIPTPSQTIIASLSGYSQACQKIPFPQVIKPVTGQKGQDVFLDIKNISAGQSAVKQIMSKYSNGALVESYLQGRDLRFLVLNFQVIGLVERRPPQISGDGRSTIKELIDIENARRHQQFLKTGRRLLNRMRHWPRLAFYLHLQGLSLKAILPQGKTITLFPISNFSTGGSTQTIDYHTIHPSLVKLAQTAAKIIGLQICGIDMIIKNLHQAAQDNATIIELNSDPGLRLHDWPNQGKPQRVAEKILKFIF